MQAICSAVAYQEPKIWAHTNSPQRNHSVTNRPICEYAQHVSVGPYEHLHMLPKMGPYGVSRFTRLDCTWVLSTTLTKYTSWAPLGPCNPSPARTPADSPATLPHPPLPENPVPAPLSASKPHKCSKPSPSKSTSKSPLAALTQHSTGPMAPIVSQFLDPVHLQASHSPGSISLNDGINLSQAARIDMLEARQCEMEMLQDFGKRLAKLDG